MGPEPEDGSDVTLVDFVYPDALINEAVTFFISIKSTKTGLQS